MIWWCVEHEVGEAEPRDVTFPDGCIHEMEWGAADPTNCRMVEALLIVKENGEWPQWALTIIGYEANDMAAQSERILDGLATGIDILPADLRAKIASAGGDSQ